MMRGSWLALPAVLSAVLSGCSAQTTAPADEPSVHELDEFSVRDSALAGLEVGTPAAEARDLLGEPALIEERPQDEDAEIWYYADGIVVIQRGKVAFSYPRATSRP